LGETLLAIITDIVKLRLPYLYSMAFALLKQVDEFPIEIHPATLKFCGGGSSIENIEGEVKDLFLFCVSVISIQIIVIGWALFGPTRKPAAVPRIPTPRPIYRK
jgi:hypothetical protein